MAFKMKGSGYKRGVMATKKARDGAFEHDNVEVDGHMHVDGGAGSEEDTKNVEMKKDPFTPVVEDDAYNNAKLKKALARYNYFKDQKDRGVYKGDLGPMPTMDNLDDFDMNDGSYRY